MIPEGTRVECFLDKKRGGFAVRREGETAVRWRVDTLTLGSPSFHVDKESRDRVRTGSDPCVHAWVSGTVVHEQATPGEYIRYNPHETDTFVLPDGTPAEGHYSRVVLMGGRVYGVKNPW